MMTEKSNTRARARVPMGTHWNKSLLSLLLAVVMVVGLLPVTALAAETESFEGDTRTVFKTLEGTVYHPEDPDDQLGYGNRNCTDACPTIKFTKATTADGRTIEDEALLNSILQMSDASIGWWYRYNTDDPDNPDTHGWERYNENEKERNGFYFVDGKYRFYTRVCIGSDSGRADSNQAYKEYRFADDIKITLKDQGSGEAWTMYTDDDQFRNGIARDGVTGEIVASKSRAGVYSPEYVVETGGRLLNLGPKQYGVRFYVNETQVGKYVEGPRLDTYVAGGNGLYTFTKTQGPAWLNVDPETGRISGTPTAETLGNPTEYPVNNQDLWVQVTDTSRPVNTLVYVIPVGKTYQAANVDSRKAIREIKATLTGEAVPVWEGSTKITPVFRIDEITLTDGTTLDPSAAQFDTESYCYWYCQKSSGGWWICPDDAFGEDSGPHRYQYRVRLKLRDTTSSGGMNYGQEYKFADNFNLIVTNGDTYGNDDSKSNKQVKGTTAVGEWGKIIAVNKNTEPYVEVWSPVYEVVYPGYGQSNELEGKVRFTSDVRVGQSISVEVTDTTAPKGSLQYKWQYRKTENGPWQDCVYGNGRRYTPQNSMVGYKLRVVIRAAGYSFDIVSEERTIEKGLRASLYAPEVNYLPAEPTATDTARHRDRIIIFTSAGQEYVMKTSIGDPTEAGFWDGADWNDNPLGQLRYFHDENQFELNKTYYVYTRSRETSTYEVGKTYKYTTVYTGNAGDTKYLEKVTLKDEGASKEYADYGVGNTIYLKSGEETTLTVTGSPTNANKWGDIYFRAYDDDSRISVKVDGTNANKIGKSPDSGSPFNSHTLKITATSNVTLIASSTPSGEPGTVYGRWKVVVYDSDPSSIGLLNVEFVDLPEYRDVMLDVGDTYTPAGGTPNISSIKTNPEGALAGYQLVWRIGTSGVSGPGYVETADEYIKVDPGTGVVTAKQGHAAGNDTQVALCLVKGSSAWPIAYYNVTVKGEAAPKGALLVDPGSLSMKKDDIASLTAQVAGFSGAAPEGTFNWRSSNDAVATVSVPVSDGNKAEVKAIGHGDTTIVVKYTYNVNNTETVLSAAVPVAVHRWGDWQKVDGTTHQRGCKDCSAVETADHTPKRDGTTWSCADCGYMWENTGRAVLLDANGGTVSSSVALLDRDSGKPDFLPTPERSGYSFSGWYTARNGGTKVTCDTVVDESVSTLYAHWSAEYYYAGSGGGTTTAKPEKSPGMGDPGVMLYAAMGLLSLSGGAWVVGRKRKDK